MSAGGARAPYDSKSLSSYEPPSATGGAAVPLRFRVAVHRQHNGERGGSRRKGDSLPDPGAEDFSVPKQLWEVE